MIALRKQRLAELGLKDPEEEQTVSEENEHTGKLSVDDWFAGDPKRVFDGPFHRTFPSGMDIEIGKDGVLVMQMPLKGDHLEMGRPRSMITLCAEHVPHAKEWLEKVLAYLQKRQDRLNADQD